MEYSHEQMNERGVPQGSLRARQTWLKIIQELEICGQWTPSELALVRHALRYAAAGLMPPDARLWLAEYEAADYYEQARA